MKTITHLNKFELVYKDVLKFCLLLTVLAVLILSARMVSTGTLRYGFLVWNVFLAWIPALFAWILVSMKKTKPRYIAALCLLGWLFFLPNAFYIVTDFVHLESGFHNSKLFDAVMLFSFALCGIVLGLASTIAVHVWLRKRIKTAYAWLVILTVILASSFAIYLGRYLRWNSWDIVFNPLGIIFDVSERVLNPTSHPATYTTTAVFFGMLSGLYASVWYVVVSVWRRLQGR